VTEPTATLYEQMGGEPAFRALVHRFYEGVATDPVLRPLYPEEDLGPAEDRLALFLMQYWGGPTTYSDTRGHPRLRMRHAPYAVTPTAREHWVAHMRVAVDSLALPAALHDRLWDYLSSAAFAMVNTPGQEPTGTLPLAGEPPRPVG
jgi:hemoglobin